MGLSLVSYIKKSSKRRTKSIVLLILAMLWMGLTWLQGQAVKDIDGNIYSTITIGTQVWMEENLRATKCIDGTSLLLVTDNKQWETLDNIPKPAYCWYNNNARANKEANSALYNWYAVNTKKICPDGWHVPTDIQWTTLITFLGGYRVAGNKLKETGTNHWTSPNTEATNESGFYALPSGYRYTDGKFLYINEYGSWWSSTESDTSNAWVHYLNDGDGIVRKQTVNKRNGYSVRCLKDS